MKLTTGTLLMGSIITATLLFSGCGSESTTSLKAPKDTTKLIRGVADDHTDWTWFVGTDATQSASTATFTSYYMQSIPAEVKHFQYFLDTDNNAATGFSFGEDSWRISGADILVEDGAVYKSQSTSKWKWSYVGELDNYERSKVEGVEQINFSGNKALLGITSDTVNVTVEPFDANWGSTYSTISTQAVHLVNDGVNASTPDPKLTQALLPNDGVSIDKFLVTPDKKGAIVLTKGYSQKAIENGVGIFWEALLIYVDYSDLNHPTLSDKVIIYIGGFPYLETNKPIKVLDNNTVSFYTGDDNRYSNFIEIYDFKQNKTVKRLPTDLLSAGNLAAINYAKKLPNPHYRVTFNEEDIQQLTDTTWFVHLIVDRSGEGVNNPLPTLKVDVIYHSDTETFEIQSSHGKSVKLSATEKLVTRDNQHPNPSTSYHDITYIYDDEGNLIGEDSKDRKTGKVFHKDYHGEKQDAYTEADFPTDGAYSRVYHFTYNDKHQVIKIDRPTPKHTITLTYDDAGHIKTVTNYHYHYGTSSRSTLTYTWGEL